MPIPEELVFFADMGSSGFQILLPFVWHAITTWAGPRMWRTISVELTRFSTGI